MNSIPVLFQLQYVYPFLLNPVLEIIFLISFIFLLIKSAKDKNVKIVLLLLFFLFQFIPQAFLFAKWTRYMVSTLPFIYIIVAYFIYHFLSKQFRINLSIALVLISFLFSLSFAKTAYFNKDTRISAYEWMKTRVKSNNLILSEAYDLGILPFNQFFSQISLFNFYDLDTIPMAQSKTTLDVALEKNNYIVLPSPRVFRNRLANPTNFPAGHKFYKDLISDKLGYRKIYETPCDILCKIAYLGDPVFNIEETITVFDRPTVYIFKK